MGGAIVQAATDVIEGRWDKDFVVDIFQTGSGISNNMNANEVSANRSDDILGVAKGSKIVHPNDHVNMSQFSKDMIHSAIHLAVATGIRDDLIPALDHFCKGLKGKAVEFDSILKSGRTHMMDASPIRLGQEFSGYAEQAA